MKAHPTVAIVGATGAVGQELVRLLHERNFPMSRLRLFASARSAGKTVEKFGKKYTVEEAKLGAFAGVDIAFFAAGGSVTKAFANEVALREWRRSRRRRLRVRESRFERDRHIGENFY